MAKEKKYASEMVTLPSLGKFYPETHPLASGEIEVKYPTAKEEDILTSPNLMKKGIILDKLIESVILTEGVSIDDILIGDKFAILMAARIMGFGPNYNVSITCPSCGKQNKEELDLTQFKAKDLVFDAEHQTDFEFELPFSKRTVTYKYLTHKDQKIIEKDVEAQSKLSGNKDINKEVTTSFRHIITSVDGNSDKIAIRNFVENELISRDLRALRDHIAKTMPDFDLQFHFSCEHCDYADVMDLPVGMEFFWPSD